MDITKLFRETARNNPFKDFIIFDGRALTYTEVLTQVKKLTHYLLRRGVKKGDKVVILIPNSPEFIVSYLAIFGLGAVAVPLDARLTNEELLGVLNHAEAKVLITRPLAETPFDKIKNHCPALKQIAVCFADSLPGADSFNRIISDEPEELPEIEIKDSDIAVIFYTSGTTGHPKAAMLNYRSLENAAKTAYYFLDQKNEVGDMMICPLPLSHAGGFVYLQFALPYAATLVLMERFVPLEFLKNVEKYKVSWFHLVPPMFIATLALKEFEKFDLSSLKGVCVFGAPSPPNLIKRFGQYCPNARLIHGWGMSETSPPNVVITDSKKIASVGKAPPWFKLKVVDSNDKEVPAGEIGELAVKGWPVMVGYYKEPELNKEVMRGGWFHTGDLASFDEEGYLYIRGRKKDMIIVGGLNVYSPEVEHVIHDFPGVKEVAVIGVADKLRGEAIKAVIVMKGGKTAEATEIKAFCRRHLVHYKVPQVIEFKDQDLPKNRSGKIAKELLK